MRSILASALLLAASPLLATPDGVISLGQAVKQGFQDFGAKDVKEAHAMLEDGRMRMETRSGAAQHEGGVHDMHSYTKKRW